MEGHAKKKKQFHGEEQVNGEDRISVLPDSLIHHILSFLPADVIMKTSLLSKRWKDSWTSVHSLDFNGAISMEEESFMFRFMYKYLTNYKGSKLFKFRANFYYKEAKDLFVDFLLSFVKMHNIEELDLHLSARFWDYFNGLNLKNYAVELQSCLFDCQELRVLRLSCFDLNENVCFHFRYLKVLDLRLANFEYLDTSGCPLLEDLRLVDCNFMSTLNLHAPNPKLRNLNIVDSNTEWGEGGRIIRAPHVLFIDIMGDLRPSYDIKDLSSVIGVRLDFSEMLDVVQSPHSYDAFMMLMRLIENLSHAKTLKLCRSCITKMVHPQVANKTRSGQKNRSKDKSKSSRINSLHQKTELVVISRPDTSIRMGEPSVYSPHFSNAYRRLRAGYICPTGEPNFYPPCLRWTKETNFTRPISRCNRLAYSARFRRKLS